MKFFDNSLGNTLCTATISSAVSAVVVGLQGAINGAIGAEILLASDDKELDMLGYALVSGLGNMALGGLLGLIIGGAVGSLATKGIPLKPEPTLLKVAILAEVIGSQIAGASFGHLLLSTTPLKIPEQPYLISAVMVGTLVTGALGLLAYIVYCGCKFSHLFKNQQEAIKLQENTASEIPRMTV
ncbi:MAG: hypothetical protein EPN84_06115 [Legionella sp.]|nr:MAG: hypothetical protein EPN84_06115 [Legionella sp.]